MKQLTGADTPDIISIMGKFFWSPVINQNNY